jgi:hypothetical protein
MATLVESRIMEYNAGLFHDLVKVGPQRYVAGLPSSSYLETVRGLVHGPPERHSMLLMRSDPEILVIGCIGLIC